MRYEDHIITDLKEQLIISLNQLKPGGVAKQLRIQQLEYKKNWNFSISCESLVKPIKEVKLLFKQPQ